MPPFGKTLSSENSMNSVASTTTGNEAPLKRSKSDTETMITSSIDPIDPTRFSFRSPCPLRHVTTIKGDVPDLPSLSLSQAAITHQHGLLERRDSEPITHKCTVHQRIPATTTAAQPHPRRSIFGSFWEASHPKVGAGRPRSLSTNDTAAPCNIVSNRIYGCPPIPAAVESIEDQEVHKHLVETWRLPILPSPLERLRKSSGVYPLLQPKSILRNGSQLRSQKGETKSDPSFNLTQTLHKALQLQKKDNEVVADLSLHSTASSTSSDVAINANGSNVSNKSCSVHFDPRVVVTELHESEPRVWYTDMELELFKNSTVRIAKIYLMQHPEEIPKYSQEFMDPITRKPRKKALFSMPALNNLTAEELGQRHLPAAAAQASASSRSRGGKENAQPLRRILVVDRNEKILALFRRSFEHMLGNKNVEVIQCVKTAEAALHALKNEKKSFDVILAEERLYRPLPNSTSVSCLNRHLSNLPSTASVPNMATIEEDRRLSGSELFEQLQAISQDGCLLIGVSTHPEEDATKFRLAGADFVWGKPPPRMDSMLRERLEIALERKRGAPR